MSLLFQSELSQYSSKTLYEFHSYFFHIFLWPEHEYLQLSRFICKETILCSDTRENLPMYNYLLYINILIKSPTKVKYIASPETKIILIFYHLIYSYNRSVFYNLGQGRPPWYGKTQLSTKITHTSRWVFRCLYLLALFFSSKNKHCNF